MAALFSSKNTNEMYGLPAGPPSTGCFGMVLVPGMVMSTDAVDVESVLECVPLALLLNVRLTPRPPRLKPPEMSRHDPDPPVGQSTPDAMWTLAWASRLNASFTDADVARTWPPKNTRPGRARASTARTFFMSNHPSRSSVV